MAKVGGAKQGKAIIIINPAEPPLIMRDTVHCLTADEPDQEAIADSIQRMIREVQEYVPGYRLVNGPVFDGKRVEHLPGGGGPGRLPAQVRRQPRHHDRGGDSAPARCSPRRCLAGRLVLEKVLASKGA